MVNTDTVFNEAAMVQWVCDSVLGRLRLRATQHQLVEIAFHATEKQSKPTEPEGGAALCRQAKLEIDAYLDGRRQDFTVPHLAQGSPFQRRVWQLLCQIPFADTVTYGDLARRLGKAGASRAVGLACGANPLPLIIPCHRVLATGGLGGFTGGLEIKRRLLRLEAEARGRALPEQGVLPF